jgi:exosortase
MPLSRANVIVLLLIWLCVPWYGLVALGFSGDYFNAYILTIPLLSLLTIWLDREYLPLRSAASVLPGVVLSLVGVTIRFGFQSLNYLKPEVYGLSIATFGSVLIIWGTVLGILGPKFFRNERFALLLLILMIPLPAPVLARLISILQHATAAVCSLLFEAAKLPALRKGVTFSLPGVEILIKEQCCGVRSLTGLGLAAMVGGRLFLRSPWKRGFLTAITIPIAVFKNAVRIVVIAALGVYQDPGFFHGALHTYGGMLVNFVELAVLIPIGMLLYRAERSQVQHSNSPVSALASQLR